MKKDKKVLDIKEEESVDDFKPKVNWFDKIPYWIKAIFIKYWFFGALYFFFVIGIPNLSSDAYVIIYGVALGVINDIIIYKILEMLESYKKESRYFVFFRSKKLYSLFINLVYGFVIGAISMIVSFYLRGLITSLTPDGSVTWYFAMPLSFGLLALAIDGVFIGLKDLIVYLYRRFTNKEVF